MKFPAYPRYKPSGIEWLGDVPEHWGISCLKHSVNELYSGGTPESGNSEYWANEEEESIAWVSIGDMTRAALVKSTEKRITRAGLASKRLRILPAGTLLYSMYASLGKVAVLDIPATVNQAILGIVPDSKKSKQSFLRYWLIKMESHLELFSSSNTQDNLNAGKVRALPLVVPPPPEQRAIAAFLDRETGRVDRLVAKKRELIERLKEKRTALISCTVTRGLPPAAARAAGLRENPPLKPSGIDWIDEIPAHWEVKKLSWIFRYAKGPSAAMLTKEYVADNVGDYPVFSGQTENEGLMGMIDWHEFNFASPVIFVTTVGARAMSTRIVSGKFSLSQNCALIIPRSKNADPRYYEAVLRGLFDYERRSISLIMQPSLRFDDLDKFRVPLPPSEEQAAIAAYLDEETAKIDVLVGKVEEAVERLQEYRTALITAAVTGKIDVRKAIAQ